MIADIKSSKLFTHQGVQGDQSDESGAAKVGAWWSDIVFTPTQDKGVKISMPMHCLKQNFFPFAIRSLM